MTRIERRQSARRDLVDIFRHYAEEAGLAVARRFLARAEETFKRLAAMPGMGTPYVPDEPLWVDVRFFPITRFKKYIVFYRPIADGIEVLHVLHGARDIHHLLIDEFGFAVEADEPMDSGGA